MQTLKHSEDIGKVFLDKTKRKYIQTTITPQLKTSATIILPWNKIKIQATDLEKISANYIAKNRISIQIV